MAIANTGGVNITGGETISVVLKRISGTDGEESELISKKYFISKIKAVSKLTETSEGYIFELYEDVLYESNLQNSAYVLEAHEWRVC